jgi:hypothetical protein
LLLVKINKIEIKISFIIIFLIGLGLRFFYFPHELPLIADGMDYFTYSTEIISYGHLPTEWTPINNGWPIFVSFWFSIINLENSFQYMQLTKIISVILSGLTAIPIYILCKRFFDAKIALVGSAFFVFDPRILLNSFFGITEPLFILLGVSSIVLFLKYQQKFIILSFVLASFCTIVRSEGIFLLGILTVLFFLKHKFSLEIVKTYIPSLVIFILILLPIMDYRTDTVGYDGIFQRFTFATNQVLTNVVIENSNQSNIFEGFKLFGTYLGWILIPNFLIFLPYGLIQFFKKKRESSNLILVFLIIYSLPILYAYIVKAQDTRYFYFLFPIFSLISLFAVEKYISYFKRKNIVIFIIIFSLFISAVIFYELDRFDDENQKELNSIGKIISEKEWGVNYHPTISRYIYANELPMDWPFIINDVNFKTNIIRTSNFTGSMENIESYISISKQNISHIIVDENPNLPKFLQDVYHNEEKYEYLIKIFDSKDQGFNHHVKVYKINFEKLDFDIKK